MTEDRVGAVATARSRSGFGERVAGLHEVVVIGVGWLIALFATFVTYARIAPEELYHVSQTGLRGGASRALVYLNYPMAIAAVGMLAIVYDRWRGGRSSRSSGGRVIPLVSIFAVACCLVLAVPGVVDQADLDAKPINIVPAAGVLFVAGFTVLTLSRVGRGRARPWTNGDRLRVAATVVIGLVSIPWYLAAFGVYTDSIPVLDRIFIAEIVPEGETIAAVHLGDHHGLSGSLLATTAIWLTRVIGQMRPTRLKGMLRGYLALMLTYGLGNFLNDGWLEQVVKRGWTDQRIPSVTTPDLTVAWGVVVLGAICFTLILRRADQAPVAPHSAVEGSVA